MELYIIIDKKNSIPFCGHLDEDKKVTVNNLRDNDETTLSEHTRAQVAHLQAKNLIGINYPDIWKFTISLSIFIESLAVTKNIFLILIICAIAIRKIKCYTVLLSSLSISNYCFYCNSKLGEKWM